MEAPLAGTTESSLDNTTEAGSQAENSNRSEDAVRVVMLIVGSLGVVGNAFVLVVILGTKRLRQLLPNVLIINQSLIDLTAGLLLTVDTATTLAVEDEINFKGVAGELYCKLGFGSLLVWATMKSSTYNLIAITIERYLMVVFPLKHKVSFNRKTALGLAMGAWLIGLTWELGTVMPLTVEVIDGFCMRSVSHVWQKAYSFLNIIISFFIPLAIHPTMYTHMVVILTKGKQKVVSQQSTSGTTSSTAGGTKQVLKPQKLTRTQKNLFKTMAFVTVGFFLCWSWNQVYFFLYNIGYDVDPGSPFYYFTVSAANFNCCVNPLVYLVMYRDFREAARNVFLRGTRIEPII